MEKWVTVDKYIYQKYGSNREESISMALLLNTKSSSGFEGEHYIKIDWITATKLNATLRVRYYFNKVASDNHGVFLEDKEIVMPVSVDDNSENFIKQGYEFLKTLPEFAGAVDA